MRDMAQPLRPSAVLIPIVERHDGLTVLLTERAADLTHHAGQISFPGGGMEAGDQDLAATALREAEEEVGLRSFDVEIAGFLAPLPTISGFAVTPVVGLVNAAAQLTLDSREVAAAFEVPLEFLLNTDNQQHSMRTVGGVEVPVIAYHYEQWKIWGATASMIVSLHNKLLKISYL
jgi:8-oxo-dGTP pyrophosphatase MutT (NUDIX family)